MSSYAEHVKPLLESLASHADPKTKVWWEGYVKEGAPFLGVRMGVIRSAMHSWHRQTIDGRLPLDEQKDLAIELVRERCTEEKLAGMLLLQEILVPAGAVSCDQDVDRFAALFAGGSICDWNACDWFCIKVLGPLIERDGEVCARAVSKWRDAANLWQARASIVSFVILAEERTYYPLVLASCRTLVGREERFAKTAVGWILRDISRRAPELVDGFVRENLDQFSLESLRNALKHFARDEQDRYVRMLKDLQRGAARLVGKRT